MATTFEIHPAIGIARLGTSEQFYVGPEPGQAVPTTFRDATGLLMRQAARFRVYQCERDATGLLTACTEITTANATIEWTVQVANRKAVAVKIVGDGAARRNSATGDDTQDAQFIIAPSPKTVSAANPSATFDDGKFIGTSVTLGELQMEPGGRLVVLSGHGVSGSPTNQPIQIWAESDQWHDDIADGPVSAKVTLNATGATVDVVGAWVSVAPPKYAPELQNLVTLFDTLSEVAAGRGLANDPRIRENPAVPGWDADIQPILNRVMGYQWVNQAAQNAHGPGGQGDFTSATFAGIEDPANAGAASTRTMILGLLRVPGSAPGNAVGGVNGRKMPRLYGDEYLSQPQNQEDRLPLTARQYGCIQKWANGNFVSTRPVTAPLEADLFTRMQLDSCVGGAFVPGIEMTFAVRNQALYMAGEPFRVQSSVKPGSMTENMALPWQTDFTDCSWDNPTQLGWWPVQRPDFVTDSTGNSGDWLRGFPDTGGENKVFEEMIAHWSELGIVARQTSGGQVSFVEIERTYTPGAAPAAADAIHKNQQTCQTT